MRPRAWRDQPDSEGVLIPQVDWVYGSISGLGVSVSGSTLWNISTVHAFKDLITMLVVVKPSKIQI